jgi:hypothetical protein
LADGYDILQNVGRPQIGRRAVHDRCAADAAHVPFSISFSDIASASFALG